VQIADLRLTDEEKSAIYEKEVGNYSKAIHYSAEAQLAKALWGMVTLMRNTEIDYGYKEAHLNLACRGGKLRMCSEIEDELNAAGIPWPQEAQHD